MKRFPLLSLVLVALLHTHCGDMFLERKNRKMNDKIEGDWKISQVTYKRGYLGKPDSTAHDLGTIRLTSNCADGTTPTGDYCSHYAYCRPTNQTNEYEMRWSANYDMNKIKHLFNLEAYNRHIDTLQISYGGNFRIDELTKSRLVVSCNDKEIVFIK